MKKQSRLSKSQWLGILITVCAICVLVPGVLQPIISITIETSVDANIARFTSKNLDKTRSILGTVDDLYRSGDLLVAFLILFFSVIVPVAKGVLVGYASFARENVRDRLIRFVDAIGKWSMADVFVIAIFICFLSTVSQGQSQTHGIVAFGMKIPVRLITVINSKLEPGFYFFLSYCLLSLLSLHFLKRQIKETN